MPSACLEARCSTSCKARCTGRCGSGLPSSMSSEGALRNCMALKGGERLPTAVDPVLTRRRTWHGSHCTAARKRRAQTSRDQKAITERQRTEAVNHELSRNLACSAGLQRSRSCFSPFYRRKAAKRRRSINTYDALRFGPTVRCLSNPGKPGRRGDRADRAVVGGASQRPRALANAREQHQRSIERSRGQICRKTTDATARERTHRPVAVVEAATKYGPCGQRRHHVPFDCSRAGGH